MQQIKIKNNHDNKKCCGGKIERFRVYYIFCYRFTKMMEPLRGCYFLVITLLRK